MSATDWYICPKCKKTAIEYIDRWYGKVDQKSWDVLSKIREAWQSDSESFRISKAQITLLDKLEENIEGFEYSDILPQEESLLTLRYDSDTGLSEDGKLYMHEVYDCQDCEFHIEVNKKWKEGNNEEEK